MHQNAYWRNGPVENNAISGVDMALWDIKGKMANMPLYQLFGGKCAKACRSTVTRMAATWRTVRQHPAYREQGITHIRCQSGGYGGGGFGKAPSSAPRGAPDGIYLDSRRTCATR
jgi:mannonate dehydratase